LSLVSRSAAASEFTPAIVEGRVEPPIGADGALDHRPDLSGIRHVTGDANRVVTRCAHALSRLADHLLVAINKDHGRASLGEGLCRRQANATAGSHDECHFPIESCSHPPFYPI
jgi:hypothetical protein